MEKSVTKNEAVYLVGSHEDVLAEIERRVTAHGEGLDEDRNFNWWIDSHSMTYGPDGQQHWSVFFRASVTWWE